jgi:hypothetical protein
VQGIDRGWYGVSPSPPFPKEGPGVVCQYCHNLLKKEFVNTVTNARSKKGWDISDKPPLTPSFGKGGEGLRRCAVAPLRVAFSAYFQRYYFIGNSISCLYNIYINNYNINY